MNSVGFFRGCFLFLLLGCESGNLDLIASFPNALKESSAAEIVSGSELLWTLEDKGNDSDIHAFDISTGKRIKSLKVDAQNIDWEDLTSDKEGHLYIGDFGNNNGHRKTFQIYKLPNPETLQGLVPVLATIKFSLPKEYGTLDFEAFFLWRGYFYLFSKSSKKTFLFKVPNLPGIHVAEAISDFKFRGDGEHRVTSSDISENGEEVVLLNEDKLWVITDFQGDHFFEGKLKSVPFRHYSQKEGICFWGNKLIITDERNQSNGGNIYSLNCSSYRE